MSSFTPSLAGWRESQRAGIAKNLSGKAPKWRVEINNSEKFPHVDHIHDLLSMPSSLFLRAAYKCVLGRDVDEAGLRHYMKLLSQGFGKESVLIGLLNSDEARRLTDENKSGDASVNLETLSYELFQLRQTHKKGWRIFRVIRRIRSGGKIKELNALQFKLENTFLSMIGQVKSEMLKEVTHRMEFHHETGTPARSNLHTVNAIQAQRRSVSRPARED